ncbi:MAG: hypothetical protein R3C15_22580 [Thermoleophilia bacterium]
MVKVVATLVLAALAVALAGCGGGDAPDATAPPAAAEQASSQPALEPPPVSTPGARETVDVALPDGTILATTILLPVDYAVGTTYPVLLALPPGGQGQREVDAIVDAYWEQLARERGWVVVSPAAAGALFFQDGAAAIPPLLDRIASWYPPEGGRIHVAGVSNGGLSAFRAALDAPGRFSSLLAAPGFPPEDADWASVGELVELPMLLVVGGEDTAWLAPMRRLRQTIREAGGRADLIVSEGEGHIVRNVAPERLLRLPRLDAIANRQAHRRSAWDEAVRRNRLPRVPQRRVRAASTPPGGIPQDRAGRPGRSATATARPLAPCSQWAADPRIARSNRGSTPISGCTCASPSARR